MKTSLGGVQQSDNQGLIFCRDCHVAILAPRNDMSNRGNQ